MRAIWRRYPLLTIVVAIGAFVLLVPFEDGTRERANGIVVAEVVLFLVLIATLPFRAGTGPLPSSERAPHWTDWLPPLACLALWLLSWASPMLNSPLALDDHLYLYPENAQGGDGLLFPYNEHVVLLPRMWAWLVRAFGDKIGNVHTATVVARAVLFAAVLLYAHRFFLRSSGSPAAAAAAVAFLSQVPVLTEVYLWFAASLWLLPLLLLIAGLHAVERLRRQQQVSPFAAGQVLFGSAVGPLTFWIGALNGPACALLGFSPTLRRSTSVGRGLLVCCVAMAGTASGIAAAVLILNRVGSPRAGSPDLANLLVWRRAVLFSARFLTDHLLLGQWWAAVRDSFPYAYPLAFATVGGGILLVSCTVATPRATIPPLLLAVASYAVVFLSRGDIPYQTGLRVSDRYHLYAHFCLAWLMALWLGSRRLVHVVDSKPRPITTLVGIALPLCLWVLYQPGAAGQAFSALVELVR